MAYKTLQNFVLWFLWPCFFFFLDLSCSFYSRAQVSTMPSLCLYCFALAVVSKQNSFPQENLSSSLAQISPFVCHFSFSKYSCPSRFPQLVMFILLSNSEHLSFSTIDLIFLVHLFMFCLHSLGCTFNYVNAICIK